MLIEVNNHTRSPCSIEYNIKTYYCGLLISTVITALYPRDFSQQRSSAAQSG